MQVFSKSDLAQGKELLVQKQILGILFSEGTYQIEVLVSKKPRESVWPFLQLSDAGEVVDAFCTCEIAEKKGSCPHLAAAYLKVMDEEPLHIRFRESLWNQIGLICAERHGYEARCLKKTDGRYEAFSQTGKRLFSIKAKGKKFEEMLFDRPIETEETSLKFSNLSSEELNLYREGRPSKHLLYELSFWADLAKWWMLMYEDGPEYQLRFSEEEPPQFLTVKLPEVEFEFYIDLAHWPQIIPALKGIKSSLQIHPYALGKLEQIVFLPEKGVFSLEFEEEGEMPTKPKGEGIKVGEWLYFPKEGFYPREKDPLLSQRHVLKQQVDLFFKRHLKLIQRHLTEKVHVNPIPARYALHFDKKHTLHVEMYAFEQGDLHQKNAHHFGEWIYLPEKGFFCVQDQLFEEKKLEISKEKVSDFVNRHRVWLQGFEGFQTHVSGVESHLSFELNKTLSFHTRLEFTEEAEHVVDLGDWIYVEGKGFYSKVTPRIGATVKAGMEVETVQISAFIDKYREELETIPGFFSKQCPLQKSGVNIGFNEEGRIEITPEYFFSVGYVPDRVKIFGDYTYVEGEGFSLIPHLSRLPESYKQKKVIDVMAEPYFVGYELELLYPHVLSIDPKLNKPKTMSLRIVSIKREPSAKTGQWVLEFVYETDIGKVIPFTIWKAIWDGKQYLFSDAGLIFLRKKRYEWLRVKSKKRWLKKGKELRMTTLELLRLTALEDLLEPEGEGKKVTEMRQLLHNFLNLKAPSEIDVTGLQSDLRPYQKTGVAWLWFLHSYGLSGLLCDEMGLGKTHQAMALLAGIKNAHADKKPKFLVVCPTSVIYHWERLIQTFLPQFKAYVFHGLGRRFKAFSEDHFDLLLTSYGITRTENKALSNYHFDVAIFDELQVAKNEKSLTNKALKNIAASMHLGLTGTPIENRLLELKALFDLVIPTYLPNLSVFRELFVNPIEKYQDESRRQFLSRFIRPFLLRRKKSEVLTELPEKIEEVALCDLSDEQHTLYKEIVQANRDALLKELQDMSRPPPIGHIFSMLLKLKQVCNHPCLITKEIQNYKKHESGKWDLFLELLSETRDSGQKLVIFSQYLGMLDILGMHLKEEGIGFAEIRGMTRDRKKQVATFAEDPKCEVFLGSLQAAGVGIDLIAASVVIHYDRWWNPAKENQATDRVHRMGQKRGVQVFKLVTKNTIEEHIDQLIESKLSLAKGVIGFDEQDQIKGLNREELIGLLQLLSED